jgi:uncharacterized coiled-coil protein SlyX
MPSGMNDDDDMNTGFQDPYDRLNNLEMNALESSFTMMELGERVSEHSQLGVKISTNLIEIVRHIDLLTSKLFELEHRLKEVERK